MSTLKKRGQQLAAALLVATGVAGTAYAMQRPNPAVEPLSLAVSTVAVIPTPTVTSTATPAPLVVFVSGEVVSPGVYTLPPHSRVVDAIMVAGGLSVEADANAVNQAVVLEDGMQIHIPRVGEVPTPLPLSGGDGENGSDATDKININTASLEALDTLPGIGPALAEAIIHHRETNGAFESVEELLEVPGIGDAKLADIREHVTVE